MAPRLLIVDDEAGVRFFVRVTFEEHGYDVDEAQDGPEALRAAADGDYAAIVLDQRMPEMTGIQVAEELTQRGDATARVLYSGYIDDEVAARARSMELPVVDKSEVERLVSTIQALTSGWSPAAS